MDDPVGSTFGMDAPATGSVTVLAPAHAHVPATTHVQMDAMLQQMQGSVRAAATARQARRSEKGGHAGPLPPAVHARHTGASHVGSTPTPTPTPTSTPTARAVHKTDTTPITSTFVPGGGSGTQMAQLFESLLRPPAAGASLASSDAGAVDDGDATGCEHLGGVGGGGMTGAPEVRSSPSLPPMEIPSMRHASLDAATVPSAAQPDWLHDATIRAIFRTKWFQLRNVWDIACDRLTQRVRTCEVVLVNMSRVAAMRQEAFAPTAEVSDMLLRELQQQFRSLSLGFGARETIVWNVRKNLRCIAQHLHYNRIPTLPSWRDEVGTTIVQQLNKAITDLSSRRPAPAPVPAPRAPDVWA